MIQRLAEALKNTNADTPPLLLALGAKLGLKARTPAKPYDSPQPIPRPGNSLLAGSATPAPKLSARTLAEMKPELVAVGADVAKFETYSASLPPEERTAFAAVVARNLAAAQARQRAASKPTFVMECQQWNTLSASDKNAWTAAGGKVRGPSAAEGENDRNKGGKRKITDKDAEDAADAERKTRDRGPQKSGASTVPMMTLSAWRALTPLAQHDFIMVRKGKLTDDPPPVPSRQEDLPAGTVNRATFDGMSHKQRNGHFRTGGRLVD